MSWKPPQKILVPVDFSDLSIDALQTARELAAGARITVVHVLADLSAAETGELWRTIDHEMRKKHALQALQERLSDPRYESVGLEVLVGEPGHAIAQFAEEVQADLIVIPSHGRTGIRRMLIGSVAERVVRYAHCPVLVLRK